MPLPHSINITSGGTGADPGEMFFGDQVDRLDGPPGFGSRGFSPGEDALSKNFNRSAFALAENDEYLGDIVTKREIACKEVGVLTAFTGNNIKIDPSGGAAGDVNYSGTLYLGEAGWPASQENLDTLFQLLDEDYNEVIVDGEEVKIDSIQAPRAVGQGFVALITQLNLSATIPSGNYRIGYGRGRTLETMPPYALISADIRGMHEAPAESQFRHCFVCATTNTRGPADFIGASAVVDALAALPGLLGGEPFTLFLRGYGIFTAPANITESDITIVAEGDAADGAILRLPTGQDLTISGNNIHLGNVRVDKAVAGEDRKVSITGSRCSLERSTLANIALETHGTWCWYKNLVVGGHARGLYVANGSGYSTYENIAILPGIVDDTNPAFDVAGAADYINGCSFKDVRVTPSASAPDQVGFHLYKVRESSFKGLDIESYNGLTFSIGESILRCSVEEIKIKGRRSLIKTDVLALPNVESFTLRNVTAENTIGVPYDDISVLLHAQNAITQRSGIILDGAVFRDDSCTCTDGVGGGLPMVKLVGVEGRDIIVEAENQPSNNEDGPLIYTEYSRLQDVILWMNSTQTSVATVSNGAVEVMQGAYIKNLYIAGGNEEHQRPLLYMEGQNYRLAQTAPESAHKAEVDGYQVWNYGVSEFYIDPTNAARTGDGIAAKLSVNARLRDFSWGDKCVAGNDAVSAIRPQCLVELAGSYSEVVDAKVNLEDQNGSLLRYVVMVKGGAAFHGVRINDNKIRVVNPKGANVNLQSAIRAMDSLGELGGVIEKNHILWEGDATPAVATASVIVVGQNNYMWKVINNHIEVDDLTGSGTVIYFDEPGSWPAGAGGTPGGGAICMGNTVINMDASALNTLPAITAPGGAVIGAALNVLGAM